MKRRRREGAAGTIVWSSSRARQPRSLHDEDRRLGRKADHEGRRRSTGSRASRPTARRSCSAAARRAGSASATPTPATSGTSSRSAPTARDADQGRRQRQLGQLDRQRRDRLRARHRRSLRTQARLDGDETLLIDSTRRHGRSTARCCSSPSCRSDGNFIAITLRGSKRETGIWNLAKKTWTQTGLGCQINWTPDGSDDLLGEPDGQRRQRVFHMPIADGKPPKERRRATRSRFMDMPGRRSHEYFPQLSRDGKWLVWGITQRGHDHDIADYEIYLWEVGTPPETRGAAHVPLGQRSLARHLHPGRGRARRPTPDAPRPRQPRREPPSAERSGRRAQGATKHRRRAATTEEPSAPARTR